jgi:hypothetical protein
MECVILSGAKDLRICISNKIRRCFAPRATTSPNSLPAETLPESRRYFPQIFLAWSI